MFGRRVVIMTACRFILSKPMLPIYLIMGVVEVLNEVLNVSEPISFEEYCKSEEYLGDPYIYDFWISEFNDCPPTINEICVDGSLGGGKTYAVSAYITYRIMLLFRDGDPRPRYSLKPMSALYGFYFSTNKTSAKKGGFKYLYQAFTSCAWFKNNMPVDETIESIIRFPSVNFEIMPASSDSHAIGLNVWCFILDEANFKEGVGIGNLSEYEEITRIYTQLADRLSSRFSTPTGTEGLGVIISSASYQSSFTEKRKEILKKRTDAKIITAVAYKVKPWQFSKETFRVFVGCGAVPPEIIESNEQELQISQIAGISGNESEFFVDVPMNLKNSFVEDIDLALQNHCGIPTKVKGRFLSSVRTLVQCYSNELPKVFSSETLVASTDDDTELIEYFIPSALQYPERPHSLFLDLSLSGDTGSLVCFRYDGINDRGEKIHTRVFSLRIMPPPAPAKTRIVKITNLVISLSDYITISAFGSDQFQSEGVRQDVQAALGLENIRLSLDSSDVFYIKYLQALVSKRITMAPDELLEKEATESVHDYTRHRVIKSKGSSDDCLQGNVGAFALSETIASSDMDVASMYGPTINLVGHKSHERMLQELGYI